VSTLRKIVTLSCTALALLILGVTILIAVQGPVFADRTGEPGTEPVAREGRGDTPFEFQISERPRSVDGASRPEVSRAVNLSAGEVVLNHYDVYYTDEGCILALHLNLTPGSTNLKKVYLGMALRARESGFLFLAGGGSLAGYAHMGKDKPEGRDAISESMNQQGPFTTWITFKSVDLDEITERSGRALASEAANPQVEIYLSDDPRGLTYAGRDGPRDDTSPFIKITDIQPFRRN